MFAATYSGVWAHSHWDTMMWGWWWMWLLVIVVLLGIVVAVVAAVWASTRRTGREDEAQRAHARDILDERYARGEIDREEYEERRRTLDAHGS